ncbi:MAG TPA: hypothetical protein VFV40_10405 [Nocardioides sp.]|nr:hypothetical protein [Nocardioides sp.]
MGLFRKAMVVGVAKKVYDEARKPHNQQKIREAYASFQDRRGGRKPSGPRPSGPPPTDPR